MRIVLRKLRARVKSLEDELGLVFTRDEGWADHVQTDRDYMNGLFGRVKKLEEELKTLKPESKAKK